MPVKLHHTLCLPVASFMCWLGDALRTICSKLSVPYIACNKHSSAFSFVELLRCCKSQHNCRADPTQCIQTNEKKSLLNSSANKLTLETIYCNQGWNRYWICCPGTLHSLPYSEPSTCYCESWLQHILNELLFYHTVMTCLCNFILNYNSLLWCMDSTCFGAFAACLLWVLPQ